MSRRDSISDSGRRKSTVSEKPENGSVLEKTPSLEELLLSIAGHFGRYQLYNVVMIAIPILMSAFINEFIFSAAAIPHRCRISECGEDNKSNTFEPEWILNAIPAADSNTGFESCSRFVAQGNGSLDYCPANIFTTATTDCNGEFVYDRENSVVYEFNLGCQEWFRALAGTLSSVGTLLVLPVTGYISDRFGRKIALVINVFNLALFGLIRAFSVNYPMYLALQLIQTALGGGILSTTTVLSVELVSPRYRVRIGTSYSAMFALGQVTVGAVAWLVPSWRVMIMCLHIPCFLVVSYYWLLGESIRWQLSKEKFDEAKASLEKIARVNKRQINEKTLNTLLNLKPPKSPEVEVSQPNVLQAVFKSRILFRRVLTTPIWWLSSILVYYGLSINATSLSDSSHLNYILTCLIEIPGYMIAAQTLDRFGRKPTICGGFMFSAVCNIAFAFMSQSLTTFRLVVYLLGKLSISIVVTSLYMYTSELYPTPYRHSLLAFSSMFGRIGSIIAPLTPGLMEYWDGIPSVMFGSLAFLSGLLVLTQPETQGVRIPDTLEEAETIGKPESMRDRHS